MSHYENSMSKARYAESEADAWEKMAMEAVESARRYRRYAENERVKASIYRDLASRQLDEINKALEGIAA